MKKVFCLFFMLALLSACSKKAYIQSLQSRIDKMQADSVLYEKRIRSLDDEKNYLAQKCATIEQAYNNRLQEKEDSLNQKESLLREREFSLSDMKARKEEEQESFQKLKQSISELFTGYQPQELNVQSNCSQIIVGVNERLLFLSGIKPSPSAAKIYESVNQALVKNADLQLIVIAYTDSLNSSKEDVWAPGSQKANTVCKQLVRDYKISETRVMPANKVADPSVKTTLSKNRVEFVFYSTLLPCIHSN